MDIEDIPSVFANSLSEIGNAYQKGDLPRVNAIYSAVLCLKGYLNARNQFMGEDIFEFDWLKEAVEKEFSSKLSKADEKGVIGNFVAALVYFGSSAIQAQKAVAEWLVVSETKVRDAYAFCIKHSPHIQARKATPADFIDGWLFYSQKKKAFPRGFKKPKEALLKMTPVMTQYFEYLRK